MGRTAQAATAGGVEGVQSGETGSEARNARGPTSVTRFPGHPARLLALLLQAPFVALAICMAFGSVWPATPVGSVGLASVLFWLGLAALWFGLSDAVIGDVLGRGEAPGRTGGIAPRLSRLGVMGALGAVQCEAAWAIVASLAGLSGAGLASLSLLILASAVGLALGCLVVATAPRPPVAWAALGLAMVSLWLFGGGPQSLPREAPWARAISNAVPSRWAFEGLLLLRTRPPRLDRGRRATGRPGDRDIAEAYFPAELRADGVQGGRDGPGVDAARALGRGGVPQPGFGAGSRNAPNSLSRFLRDGVGPEMVVQRGEPGILPGLPPDVLESVLPGIVLELAEERQVSCRDRPACLIRCAAQRSASTSCSGL